MEELDKLIQELGNLKYWFDKYYSEHEQKYRRLIELGLKCDDETEPKEKLTELYNEAEIKRKRIQVIEQEIGENNGSNNY